MPFLAGDVDAVWVENMNSVMDDNRLLTLPNGERIRLQSHCKLLIEVFDLQYASPATISRCGMTFMDPKNLGYRCVVIMAAVVAIRVSSAALRLLDFRVFSFRCIPLFTLSFSRCCRPYYVRWVRQRCLPTANGAKQKPTEAGHLQDLFDKYLPKLINYTLEGDNFFKRG